MRTFGRTLVVLLLLGGCSGDEPESSASAPTQSQAPSTATQPTPQPSSDSAGSDGEPVSGQWAGQLKTDGQADVATLNYVGAESGDFVPMRFRTASDVGAKILAACRNDDLCQVDGTVRFLDEPPPENASAVGEIVAVTSVKRLPPDAR